MKFYDYCYKVENRYWEIDLITNVSVFQTLTSGRDDICFVKNHPKNYGEKKCVRSNYIVPKLFSKKSLFATVVYRSSHYATLSLNTHTKEICIYDGLFSELNEKMDMWKHHKSSFVHLVTGKKFHQFQFKKVHAAKLDTLPFVQNDGHNCGPIASITI